MRYISWVIRSMFCKHDWKYEENKIEKYDPVWKYSIYRARVSATCNKCGWHRKYNKY